MRNARAVGRYAAAIKYDLLTALGSHACAGDKHLQRLVLRFITLIVARYNWQSDELAVGQAEIAALWSVDPRTVKRDLARLRDLGWIVVKRPAARGRVAVHGLQLELILLATSNDWSRVGSDFAGRMQAAPEDDSPTNIVPFPTVPAPTGQGTWAIAQTLLHRQSPSIYTSWFAPLVEQEGIPGTLSLLAPSRFHSSFVTTHYLPRLTAAVHAVNPEIGSVEVLP